VKYRIVRMFFRDSGLNYVVKQGLSLAEARAHCRDPETSSKTCTDPEGRRLTEKNGPWFDGYEEQTRPRRR
jgi:hypothetical protein